MRLSVHLLTKFDAEFVEKLKEKLNPGIKLTCGEDIPEPADFHILVAGVAEKGDITASPNLHTFVIPWSGLPARTRELMLEFPHIAVHNIHHNAAPTSEVAIMLMLAASKKVIPIDRALRKFDWKPRYEMKDLILMEGKTALIIGYGAIGKRIARICHALGMKVLTVKNKVDSDHDEYAKIHPISSLKSLLPETNVLLISVPMTPETQGLIGERELALLPDNAIIVNISRGLVIDEKAFYEELKSGRLYAGIDVWYNYPYKEEERDNTPPSEFPFHELDNVVMTPHLGGHSDETMTLRINALAELLNLAADGKPLPGKIDIERGY